MKQSAKYRRIISIVLLEHQNKQISLQLRDDFKHIRSPNQWGIFGGGMEKGEDKLTAAIREVKEELLIECDPEKITVLKSFEVDGALFHLFHYPITDAEMGTAVIQEGQRIGTFSPEQIQSAEIEGHLVVPHHLEMMRWYWKSR